MGNPFITKRRLIQMGLEATKGTAVPATVQTAFPVTFGAEVPIERPEFVRGFLMDNVGNARLFRRSAPFTFPAFPVSIHEAHIFGAMAVEGAVTPVVPLGGTITNDWTFTRLRDTYFSPDTFTIEMEDADEAVAFGQQWPYCFLQQFVVEFDLNSLTRISATGVAQDPTASAITGALLPKVQTNIPGPAWKLFIDDTWAGIGTTNIGVQIASARLTFNTGLVPYWSMTGDTNLDFTREHFNASNSGFVLELTGIAHSAITDVFRTERTKASGVSARAVRLLAEVDVLEGAFLHTLQFDLYGEHEQGSFQVSGEQDGQQTFQMRLVETAPALSTDPWFEMFVRNSETDFS